MKKIVSFLIILMFSFPAFAESKFTKVCEMSKRTMQKNPACSAELKEAASKVDCSVDGGHTQMNDLQKKCSGGSQDYANAQKSKIEELKSKDPNDPKMQELKQKLAAAKAERNSAH